MKCVKIERIAHHPNWGGDPVYNLEVVTRTTNEQDDKFWISGDGVVTHNCFPKDLNALMAHAKKLGVPTPFLQAVWEKNLEVRPERDWEADKGRAVTL